MSRENDRALRFYHEVLGLDHLHFGIWGDNDELTGERLKESQQRYEDYLVARLPEGTHRILDVGCGTSALSQRLQREGYEIEGLSPDSHQMEVFATKLEAPFHACRFENFVGANDFDCLIMSESAQYIPLDNLFSKAAQSVRTDGHLMICDYFVLDHATGIVSRSGHNLNKFMAEADSNGFALVETEDLTTAVVKTLEMASTYVDKVLKAIEIGTEKIRNRHRLTTRLGLWLFRKKIAKLNEQRILIDAEAFAANKRYMFMLFQRTTGGNGQGSCQLADLTS